MITALLEAVLILSFVVLLVSLTSYVYLDAPEHGMNPKIWAAISFFVPIFGFFLYVFERDDRTDEDDREMFVDGTFEVHESRADDVGFRGTAEERESENGDETDTEVR